MAPAVLVRVPAQALPPVWRVRASGSVLEPASVREQRLALAVLGLALARVSPAAWQLRASASMSVSVAPLVWALQVSTQVQVQVQVPARLVPVQPVVLARVGRRPIAQALPAARRVR